jgi:microcystin degradation protein MlrC
MLKIAVAGFSHETNTFSPLPTPYEVFAKKAGEGRGLLEREDLLKLRGTKFNNGFSGFYDVADQEGYQIEPLVFASATPSGQVDRDAFEKISDQICDLLEKQGPFDGVYLSLHGAMVVEPFEDGETLLLRKVRAIVGDIPVVASLDLHGNITEEAIALTSAMVGFRTYPHVDVFETGQRCAMVMKHLLQGKPLFKAFQMLPFIIPISSMTTNAEPARSVYAFIDDLEKLPGVVSATFMEGFPPADIAHAGPSVFAYAETQALADETAQRLFDAVAAHENEWVCNLMDVAPAVKQAIQLSLGAGKPVILADVQDNAGAGSTSDTIWLLEALVRHGAKGAALGVIYDPEAAALAHAAGEGAQVKIALGGKLVPGQKPYEAVFTVEKLADGDFAATGPMGKGRMTNLGRMVLLKLDDVRVVVSSVRTQALDQAYFRQVGIEPSNMKILVLKSSNHYRADFEPISSTIMQVAAPAAMIDDPAKIPYRNLREGVRLGGNGPEYKLP